MQKKRAWIYVRQRGPEKEMRAQIEDLRAVAAENDFEVVDVSSDHVDGTVVRRPGLRRMMAYISRHDIETVITTRLTGISRNRKVMIEVLNELQRRHVKLLTVYSQLEYDRELYNIGASLLSSADHDGFTVW